MVRARRRTAHAVFTTEKGSVDRGCQEKDNVQRIGKSLLVPARFYDSAVVANLNFSRNFETVWVASMQDQFGGTQPARVEIEAIGPIDPWWFVVRQKYAIEVLPRPGPKKDG
jgi:hypothetical protein